MTVTINGTTGIANDGGYTGDGIIFADTTPANTLVTDTSGNVGIGTSSPGAKLDVRGIVRVNEDNAGTKVIQLRSDWAGVDPAIQVATNNSLLFVTNGSERARIDSSGNLLVGNSSAGSVRLYAKGITSDSAQNAFALDNSAGTALFRVRNDGVIYTGAATYSPYNNTTGVAANMVVGAAGDLYRSTSSIKYKKNVVDAVHGLSDLLNLRAVTYEGKSEADQGKTFGGLIAEEVHEAGLTEFVQYAEDGTPDALAYGNMVSLCIKAIQEQQAIITQLQADVAALKGA